MRVLDAARADEHIVNRGDHELLFAALFHDVGKSKTARVHPTDARTVFFGHQIVSARMARRWLENMKMPSCGVSVDNVVHLIENHMFETKSHYTDRAIRRFIAKIGPEIISKLLDLRLSDNRGGKHPSGIKGVLKLRKRITEEMAKKPPFGAKDLAINGHDLMDIGIPAGPQMGNLIKALVETVLDAPEQNDKEKLIALARDLVENGGVDRILARGLDDNIGEGGQDELEETKSQKSRKA
jgi:poly(A) polymerase/tRNA nucleotidyltransferase (CCA-adding enzyme)